MDRVLACADFHPDPRGLEALRQCDRLVIVLKIAERIGHAHTTIRRHLGKTQGARLAAQQAVDRQRHAAGDRPVRFTGLHQHEFQPKLARRRAGHDLHGLHFDMHQGIRLHQAAIERQVLSEAGDLALHVPEAPLHLLVPFTIDPARHIGGLQFLALTAVLRLQIANARSGREGAAHRIHQSKARIVAAQFEHGIEHEENGQGCQREQHGAALRRVRSNHQLAEQIHHEQ